MAYDEHHLSDKLSSHRPQDQMLINASERQSAVLFQLFQFTEKNIFWETVHQLKLFLILFIEQSCTARGKEREKCSNVFTFFMLKVDIINDHNLFSISFNLPSGN